MIIHPEVIVTPDFPTVQFREDRENVDLERELPRILNAQGWGIGTYFNVQFISHDRTRLLSAAMFVVIQVTEGLVTNEANPYQPTTRAVFTRVASQMTPFKTFVPAVEVESAEPKKKVASK